MPSHPINVVEMNHRAVPIRLTNPKITYRKIWDGEDRYAIVVSDDIAIIYTCDVPVPLLHQKLYDLQVRYSDNLPNPIPEFYELSDGTRQKQN